MKHALIIMIILSLPIVAVSESIGLSLASAVKTSDVIVIGTLRNVSEETRDGIDYGSGEITIDEIILGKAEPGQTLILVWQNESNVDCPRVEHRSRSNKQLIWLLTVKQDGKVAADNLGRVAPIEKKETVLELVRKLNSNRAKPIPK